MAEVKELKRFKDIQKCKEFDKVKFYGKLLDIIKLEEGYIFKFFDGSSNESFRIFMNQDPTECYELYQLYLFEGYVGMGKYRYFKAERISSVVRTIELERIYFPERFKVLSTEMKNAFFLAFNKIQDDGIRYLVGQCLGVPVKGLMFNQMMQATQERYFRSPASISRHDSFPGGLIAHIAGMLKQVETLETIFGDQSVYRPGQICNIDWDILRAIVYLHDCGKPMTYHYLPDGRVIWKDEMKLDHATQGVCYVYHCWVNCRDKVSEEKVQKILYGIANHMNDKHTGSIELEIFKNLDRIDAMCADSARWT